MEICFAHFLAFSGVSFHEYVVHNLMELKRQPLKVLVLSDLHTEFTKYRCKCIDWSSLAVDVIVLAGDISCGMGARNWLFQINKSRSRKGLSIVHILMIFGNHEGYSKTHSLEMLRYKWKCISDAKEIPGFTFLDNSTVQIRDVLFLGTTLWTDLKEATETNRLNSISSKMNDFRRIKYWSTDVQIQEHELAKEFIKSTLKSSGDAAKVCIVSHHLPTMASIDEQYTSFLNCAYASELTEFKSSLAKNIDVWIHGHTHTSWDYEWKTEQKTTRVVCNPRGYPYRGKPENEMFDPCKIIEI